MKRILLVISFVSLVVMLVNVFADEAPVCFTVEECLPLAEQGDAVAQYNLGSYYSFGKGVPDYIEARKWYLKAAEQGDAQAQGRLGFIYGTGKGVPIDNITAYAWYNASAAQGDETAKGNREVIEDKLDTTALAGAQKLSREYFKKYVEPFQ